MRASVFMAGNGFARLRRRIAEIEGREAVRAANETSRWLVSRDERTSVSEGRQGTTPKAWWAGRIPDPAHRMI